MHEWGDLDDQGRDICYRVGEAAYYIGNWLRKWARISVIQEKEKFGTVRVYCYFGWTDLGCITHPGWYRRPRWACRWYWISWFNWVVIPVQAKMYRMRYKMAIKKWPDLREEILSCVDYFEALEGL